jgi:hypothetical protein
LVAGAVAASAFFLLWCRFLLFLVVLVVSVLPAGVCATANTEPKLAKVKRAIAVLTVCLLMIGGCSDFYRLHS